MAREHCKQLAPAVLGRQCPAPRDLSAAQPCLEAVPTTILDCTWPKGGVGTLPKGIPVCSLELDSSYPSLQEGAILGVCLGA